MKYVKQLDGIRGIGIFTVVIFHWLPVDSYYNTFPNRPFGVDVFFVLSGYLITHLLLAGKEKIGTGGTSTKLVYVNFLLRRALRIFPAYYLTVLLIFITHRWLEARFAREVVPVLTYTLNFHFNQKQYWGDLTTHLWTLSIEEQFYLFWPWIILLINKKLLPHVIALFIAAGIVSQLLITDQEFGYLPTYTCFDAFGIGAALSWIRLYRPRQLSKAYFIIRILGMVSLIVLAFGAMFPDLIFLGPQRTLRSLVAAWAICYVIYKEHKGDLQSVRFFNSKILMFLGKISYGMYLYHIFFPWMYYKINHHVNRFLPASLEGYLFPITILENFILLILISWLSWKYIERPVLNSKLRTQLKTQPSSSQPSSAFLRMPIPVSKNWIRRMIISPCIKLTVRSAKKIIWPV